jgi:hypothetical protein
MPLRPVFTENAANQPRQPTGSGSSRSNPFVDRPNEAADRFPAIHEEEPTTRTPLSPDTNDEPYNNEYLATQARLGDLLEEISQRLARNNIHPPPEPTARAKPRAPDTFDGSDPQELDTFILQCSLYITLRRSDFPEEAAKVAFMLSYLKGAPLDWFQTELVNSAVSPLGYPIWYDSIQLFTTELRRLFGPRDPVADATIALENLRYRDSGKAVKYSLDFNRYALKTGWNDMALTRLYYKGLPDRLKDELVRIGRPNTLAELQNAIQILDQRYWERQNEISREKRIAPPSNATPGRSDKTTPTRNSAPPPSSSSPASKNSSRAPPNVTEKLGPDGRLKKEERDYRFANKLCLFCGKAGHVLRDCRKRLASDKKPAVKGRAAEVDDTTASIEEVKE